jgi:hypothetical protein
LKDQSWLLFNVKEFTCVVRESLGEEVLLGRYVCAIKTSSGVWGKDEATMEPERKLWFITSLDRIVKRTDGSELTL